MRYIIMITIYYTRLHRGSFLVILSKYVLLIKISRTQINILNHLDHLSAVLFIRTYYEHSRDWCDETAATTPTKKWLRPMISFCFVIRVYRMKFGGTDSTRMCEHTSDIGHLENYNCIQMFVSFHIWFIYFLFCCFRQLCTAMRCAI